MTFVLMGGQIAANRAVGTMQGKGMAHGLIASIGSTIGHGPLITRPPGPRLEKIKFPAMSLNVPVRFRKS